jgi:4-hydroxy-tetrahydrodipicolinate synthase
MYEHIFGIVPPMTTPFRADNTLDEDALRMETRYLVEQAKVHGLAVCGSTGEGHTLTTQETRRITEIVIKEVQGRLPVITGIITDSTAAAIERGKAVKDLGVAALQVTPPHYLFRPDDDAMLKHFEALAKGTGVPVMIYNVVPWAYLSPQLLTRIITNVEGVIGVKQSAGDMKLLADLILLLGNRGRIMSAVDALMYPSFILGAHGAIAAILAAVPTLYVQLWDAVVAGDHKQALALHEKLLGLWNAMGAGENGNNLPANAKTVQALLGRKSGLPRPPMPVSSPAQTAAIRGTLQAAGLL